MNPEYQIKRKILLACTRSMIAAKNEKSRAR